MSELRSDTQTMPSAFDPQRELAKLPTDRAKIWQLIQDFAADWLRPVSSGDGYPDDQLDAAEARLDRHLPAALREAYALLGRRGDLTGNQDVLLRPDQLYVDSSGRVLVFRRENQACAHWGVPLTEVWQPDPPAVWELLEGSSGQGWHPFLNRLSVAILDMVLSESMFGADGGYSDNRELGPASVRTLERHYTRLAIPDYPLWAEPEGPPVRWFGGPDVLLWDHGRYWLWVRARTPEALAKVRETLPGSWVMAGA